MGILIYRNCHLGLALAAGAVAVGVLYDASLKTWFNVPYAAITSSANLYLAAALYFIMLLENVLRNQGITNRILKDFNAVLPDVRSVLVIIPALIGLLPSFGGAVFSAPLVKKTAEGLRLSGEHQFMINYWFRHVWEFFLPIYPGVLLAAAIIGVSTREIVVHFFWFGILMLIVGLLFLIRPVKPPAKDISLSQNRKEHFKDLIIVLSPVTSILALVILLRWEVAWAVGLVVGILFLYYRYSFGAMKKAAEAAFNVKIMLIIAGALIFKEMMFQSGAVPAIVAAFEAWEIPGVMMIGTLCLVVSGLTGLPLGAIGAVFPLILSYPPEMHMPLAMVGMVCTAAGHMLTPTHLCLSATLDIFGTTFMKVLPQLILLETIMVSAAFIAYYFW
jgi:integral membrane protein (TIGR00529 family)